MTICKKAKNKLVEIKKSEVERKEERECWASIICPKCGCSDIRIISLSLIGECLQCTNCESTYPTKYITKGKNEV